MKCRNCGGELHESEKHSEWECEVEVARNEGYKIVPFQVHREWLEENGYEVIKKEVSRFDSTVYPLYLAHKDDVREMSRRVLRTTKRNFKFMSQTEEHILVLNVVRRVGEIYRKDESGMTRKRKFHRRDSRRPPSDCGELSRILFDNDGERFGVWEESPPNELVKKAVANNL